MYNSDLYTNYLIIVSIFIVMIIMIVYAIVTKLLQDYLKRRHGMLLKRYLGEIKQLFQAPDRKFSHQLDDYYKQNGNILKRGMEREVFETALLQILNENEMIRHKARETAYRFSFEQESIANLSSNNLTRQLQGCQQVGAYLYEDGIPLLFQMLSYPMPQLQYITLLSLAEFGQPELIVQAFDIIEYAVLVNDRAVREIVRKMGDRKSELFDAILKGNSSILVPLFLKFMDSDSANTYLDRIITFTKSEDMELRIAAVRALTQTKNKQVVLALIDAMQDKDWEVRAAAAKGLQAIPDQDSYFPLLHAMSDPAWWVRQNAAVAVLSLPSPESLIKKALLSGDAYALDSLYHAADRLGMTNTVKEIQEQLDENEIQQPKEDDLRSDEERALA